MIERRNPQRMLPHEHRQQPIGAMFSGRRLQTEPSYWRTLQSVGLIQNHTSIPDAFRVWAKVCTDAVVLRTQTRIKSTYKYAVGKNLTHKTLEAMTVEQISELRSRIEGRSEQSSSNQKS